MDLYEGTRRSFPKPPKGTFSVVEVKKLGGVVRGTTNKTRTIDIATMAPTRTGPGTAYILTPNDRYLYA
jgi:hypothetical protein